jgi:hypothetical protein
MRVDQPEEASSSDLSWKKSSRSRMREHCVEVASAPGGRVAVRDSKDPSGQVLCFGREAWHRFTRVIKRELQPLGTRRNGLPSRSLRIIDQISREGLSVTEGPSCMC